MSISAVFCEAIPSWGGGTHIKRSGVLVALLLDAKINNYYIHNKRPHQFEPAACIFSTEENKNLSGINSHQTPPFTAQLGKVYILIRE